MVYNIEYFSKKTETEKCVLSFKYIVYSHIHVLKCMKSSNLFFATKSSISFCRVMLYKDKKILISYPFIQIASSVQFSCSLVSDSLWCQASLSITNIQSLLKLMSNESVMPSNHLVLTCPLLLLPSVSPSIRVFSKESVLRIRRPKYWSFSFSVSPSNEYSGLVSFRIDLFDLLAVQGILKTLQHHSPKASILQCSAFFIFQLSHPYMTTGKTIALTRQTFVGKVLLHTSCIILLHTTCIILQLASST